jgi:hypothetical protein
VRDANGKALSYVYYENEPGRRSAAKLLTKMRRGRLPANIAKLLELSRKSCLDFPPSSKHAVEIASVSVMSVTDCLSERP